MDTGRVTLRPGMLVAVRTKIEGGHETARHKVLREVLPAGDGGGDGLYEKTEIERRVADVEEFERACKARASARYAIARVCLPSDFGLLCVLGQDVLDAAIRDADAICRTFNDTARYSKIRCWVLVGSIAESDTAAQQALMGELREAIGAVREAVRLRDPGAIRDAAAKALALAPMIDQPGEIEDTVRAARRAATDLIQSRKRNGDDTQAAGVLAQALEAVERYGAVLDGAIAEIEASAPDAAEVLA